VDIEQGKRPSSPECEENLTIHMKRRVDIENASKAKTKHAQKRKSQTQLGSDVPLPGHLLPTKRNCVATSVLEQSQPSIAAGSTVGSAEARANICGMAEEPLLAGEAVIWTKGEVKARSLKKVQAFVASQPEIKLGLKHEKEILK
jgi:hypothetical protein